MEKHETFTARVELPVSAQAAYDWHLRPGAFQRMSPPWEVSRVLSNDGVRNGGRTVIEIQFGPTKRQWIAEHRDVVDGVGFVDEQIDGPFAYWRHQHRVEPLGPDRCVLEDHVDYRLPLGDLGQLFGGGIASRRLERMFEYRHSVLRDDLLRHQQYGDRRLRVAITGHDGLVGRNLSAMLSSGGHTVVPLVRREPKRGELRWDPMAGTIDREGLAEVDAVIHLAGESIADGRWSDEKKRRITDSRVMGTRLIAETLASLTRGPRTLVSVSAIGWYGDRDTVVDEGSERGQGFLPEVCEAWERAADPARAAGIRVTHPRLGIVLSPAGGALPPMATAFSTGVGGRVGSGKQGMSWIAIDDVLGALHAALLDDALVGPLNVTSPNSVSNAEFADTLGKVMHRPSAIPLPGLAVKLAFGEMGERLLLEGAWVKPRHLLASNYRFSYPELMPALEHLMGRHSGNFSKSAGGSQSSR